PTPDRPAKTAPCGGHRAHACDSAARRCALRSGAPRKPTENRSACGGLMTSKVGGRPDVQPQNRVDHESIRTGHGADAIAEALIDHLHYVQAKLPAYATRNDWYMALAHAVRDRVLDRYITTLETMTGPDSQVKLVAYLSAEFLTGPHLGNALINLGIWQATDDALSRLGHDLPGLLQQEE